MVPWINRYQLVDDGEERVTRDSPVMDAHRLDLRNVRSQRHPFPGSIQPPIPLFWIPFVGFGGDRVHAHRKYRLNWLVLKIERF